MFRRIDDSFTHKAGPFIYDHGRLLFNEAEDAVGTRMLYQYTKLDIVRLYMDYIVAQMGE